MPRKERKPELVPALIEREGGLSEQSVAKIAEETGVSEAEVWGTGTFYSLLRTPGKRVRVCGGLSCHLAGAEQIVAALRARGVNLELVNCLGRCDRAPATLDENLEIGPHTAAPGGITPDDPALPLNLAGTPVAVGATLARAREIGPNAVISAIEASGLQGRGGAGFPAHAKWRSVRGQSEPERYVVCNADEGEPGTFKDRELLLRRPDLVIEGLAIAATTVGARDVIVYVRGEFRAERRSLETALEKNAAALADFAFRIETGHGAYICGEETALLEALEGKRGMPRSKPPYPTERGYRGKPTLIHNVETIACIPSIIARGGDWFRTGGRTGPGTKLYSISGHVGRPGVYELPLGVCLDEVVAAAGGYVGDPVAFSPGGASSGFLPISERRRPLDYRALAEVGSMLGTAGVVVLNVTVDIADAVRRQLAFFESESCGQCAPCRIGTRYLRESLDRFLLSRDPSALRHVDDVAWEMTEASHCGLGMVAAQPLVTARRFFPGAFAPSCRG